MKDKIYEQLVQSNLYNRNYNAVITRLSQKLKKNKTLIANALKELVKEKAIKVKGKTFVNTSPLVSGIFHSLRGDTGIVCTGESNTQFGVTNIKGALEGDTVQIYVNPSSNRPFAVMNKILKHNKLNVVGRVILTRYNTYAFIPDDKRLCRAIMIEQNDFAKECVGKKCIVTLENNDSPKDFVPLEK